MKKILSLILSVLMIFSCVGVATASAYSDDHLPQVYVEGLESKGVYYKDDVNMENPLFFPIQADKLIGSLVKYEDRIKKAIAANNPNLLTEYVTLWMDDCFGDVALGKDGFTMSDKVMVPKTELDPYGDAKEGKYVFKYDCRLGGVDIAAELVDYIEWVKSVTGSAKVELVASSYGSAVVLSLLNEYPGMKASIDSVLLCVPSANGVSFAGELFSGHISSDPKAIKAFLDNSLNDDAIAMLLSTLIKTGTLDFLVDDVLEPALEAALMDALRNVIRNIFGTMPSMWSFVEDKYFYDALVNIYGENYADEDHEYAGLINRITYYHENIQNRADEILLQAQAEGIHTNIICKYGDPSIPLSSEGDVLGDGFVTVKNASFGATAAMNNEKLPADYKQAKFADTKNYMSPDWCIDASTCLLPDNTWFIKNLWHGTKSKGYYEMINTIVYENLTIDSGKYDQFLVLAEDGSSIVPLVVDEQANAGEEKETTWLEDFFSFIKNFFPRLIEMIKGLFSK